MSSEDTRIATRLSELHAEITNQVELERQSTVIQSFRLDVRSGQQCVRDFFVLMNENLENWPDVYAFFAFQMITSTTCTDCGLSSQSESTQMYEEMQVPPDQSFLKHYLEQSFNEGSIVESYCQDGCKKKGTGEKRTTLKSVDNSKLIIIILSRAIETNEGYKLVRNRVKSMNGIFIR